ncbi:MAG: hypothetical protein ACI9XC_000182 [Gammaproteobacteria bacterium]|jgi:hypothetical protein
MNKFNTILVMFCLTGLVVAQDSGEFAEALPPPDIPDSIQSGEPIEPTVTIIQKDDSVVEEYRVNGNLYMVKITPSVGPAYFLTDQDGDGYLESRTDKLRSKSVPQWILFSW